MRMAVQALTRTIGLVTVDPATGRLRAEVIQATAANLLATVSLAASQTLGTLSNQTQMGGFNAQDQIPALMRISADNLRRNISVN
jgi:predicted lipoprotein